MRMRHARGKREAHRRDCFQPSMIYVINSSGGTGDPRSGSDPLARIPAAAYKYNTAQQDAGQPFIFQARDRPGA